jgi:hypothetical protein
MNVLGTGRITVFISDAAAIPYAPATMFSVEDINGSDCRP